MEKKVSKFKKFFVKYVRVVKNEYLYDNQERMLRRRLMELRYDLEELEQFYKKKEKEKKAELINNIRELLDKKDKLQKEYDDERDRLQKELDETYESQRRRYQLISDQLLLDIQDLSLEKTALECNIDKMKRELPKESYIKNQSRRKRFLERLQKIKLKK